MTKLTVAFRNFANAPKNPSGCSGTFVSYILQLVLRQDTWQPTGHYLHDSGKESQQRGWNSSFGSMSWQILRPTQPAVQCTGKLFPRWLQSAVTYSCPLSGVHTAWSFIRTLVHTPSEVADSRQDTWTTVFCVCVCVSFLKLRGAESLRS
jgi:hypothetical protein